MKKTYSINTFLPLLLFIAVAVIVLVLFLAPGIFRAIKTYQELGNVRKKVLVLSKKTETLEKIDRDNIKDMYERVNYYLPSNKDVSILMDSISQVTSQTGITFESLKLAPGDLASPSANLAKDIYSLEVSITLNGDFPSLINFIKNLKDVSPVIKLENISAGKKFKADSSGSIKPYTFEIVLVTYYKPLPSSMGNISEEVKPISDVDTKYIMQLPKPAIGVTEGGAGDQNYNSGRTDPFSKF